MRCASANAASPREFTAKKWQGGEGNCYLSLSNVYSTVYIDLGESERPRLLRERVAVLDGVEGWLSNPVRFLCTAGAQAREVNVAPGL